MSIKEFVLPDIGEGIAEGEIVSWKVTEGEVVKEEQDFVEVMTDKATVTITVPHDGVIKEIRAKEGDVVPVHEVIAVIDTGGVAEAAPVVAKEESSSRLPQAPEMETVASVPPSPVPQTTVSSASPGKVLAAPATRKNAREAGLDLSTVPGTGPGGRVTNEDLERFLQGGGTSSPTASPSTEAPRTPSFAPISVETPSAPELVERVPFRGVRKKIAEAMARSKFTATHFSVVEDLDVTELVALRNEVKSQYAENGVKVTYLPFIMKAVVAGLRAFPWLNASLDEVNQEIVLKRFYNLGIATDTDSGLIVPVIKDVDRKSIVQIAKELQDMASRTREGKINPEDLKGGSFSITNAGNIGGLFATPIINFPEVAILGVHKIHQAPRVVDGQIQIRDVMYLSVSIDHRIVDGADGVRFLNLIKTCLEDPKKLLLEA
jgi:pyruvate dehydrogenase E2 component (dihydrolipoamide acetyltransferase)